MSKTQSQQEFENFENELIAAKDLETQSIICCCSAKISCANFNLDQYLAHLEAVHQNLSADSGSEALSDLGSRKTVLPISELASSEDDPAEHRAEEHSLSSPGYIENHGFAASSKSPVYSSHSDQQEISPAHDQVDINCDDSLSAQSLSIATKAEMQRFEGDINQWIFIPEFQCTWIDYRDPNGEFIQCK